MKPILGMTMGDICGIGPEITVKALLHEETYAMCRPVVIGSAKAVCRAPVSYTHLDVYKRQGKRRGKAAGPNRSRGMNEERYEKRWKRCAGDGSFFRIRQRPGKVPAKYERRCGIGKRTDCCWVASFYKKSRISENEIKRHKRKDVYKRQDGG